MSQILTQDEINSLMDGLENGEVPTGEIQQKKKSDYKVELFDFSSQSESIGARMPAFDVINETFSRTFRTDMYKMLGENIDISSNPIETPTFGTLVQSLPTPTSMHIFSASPLKGNGLIIFDSKLIFNLVNALFGGFKTEAYFESREFTSIENIIIAKVIKMFIKNIKNAWSPLDPNLDFVVTRSEFNPQFANITTPDELVVATTFDIEFAKSLTTIILCVPYSMIEELREKLAIGFQTEKVIPSQEWNKRFIDIILSSFIDVKVNLGSTMIDGQQLVDMEKGTIIQLDQDIESNLLGFVNSQEKLTGSMGDQRGLNAFKVIDKKIIKKMMEK